MSVKIRLARHGAKKRPYVILPAQKQLTAEVKGPGALVVLARSKTNQAVTFDLGLGSDFHSCHV